MRKRVAVTAGAAISALILLGVRLPMPAAQDLAGRRSTGTSRANSG